MEQALPALHALYSDTDPTTKKTLVLRRLWSHVETLYDELDSQWTNGCYNAIAMAITMVLQENGDVGSLYTFGIIWIFQVPASVQGDYSITFTRAFDSPCATFWKAGRPDKYTQNLESGCDCSSISDAAIENSPAQYR